MSLRCLLLAGVLAGLPASASAEMAVLQGLDKITARISTFDAPVDLPVRFGSLEITARTCHKTPPEEPPESAAFLEIVDVRPDSDPVPVFTGWMFASSPAVSAMEHPVYDVWVIDCKPADGGQPSASEEVPASDIAPGSDEPSGDFEDPESAPDSPSEQ